MMHVLFVRLPVRSLSRPEFEAVNVFAKLVRCHELDDHLAKAFPQYAELASPRPLELSEAQALLGPDEALVAWVVGWGARGCVLSPKVLRERVFAEHEAAVKKK